MEVIVKKQENTDSSSSEISLNTNDVLRDLAIEFGENKDGVVSSSSSATSLLGESETIPVIQRNVCKINQIKNDQLADVLSSAPLNYKISGITGINDFDNDGTDSEICEINSKAKYSTIRDAVYVPPMYPTAIGDVKHQMQNLPAEKKDVTENIPTHRRERLRTPSTNNQVIGQISDSGKTSCSSFSSDEVGDISLLTDTKSALLSRPSSSNSWITSSSSLEGDIESFVDEDLGDESDSDIYTNRTVTKGLHNAFSTSRSIFHHNGGKSPTDQVVTCSKDELQTVDAATPTKLQTLENFLAASSSSEASLGDIKIKLMQCLAERLSSDKVDHRKNFRVADVKKTDENATMFLKRKLNLLRTLPATQGQNYNALLVPQQKELCTGQEEIVPTTWINRLQLKTFQAKLEKLATNPMHNSRTCVSCREASNIIEQKTVLRSLLLRAQRPLIEEKIEQHLVMHNSISLIGDLARTLSKTQQQESKLK